jgi:hypothetical protein
VGKKFNRWIYKSLYALIETRSPKLNQLIPSFLIAESLIYFEGKEQYEKCNVIKIFVDHNPSRIQTITRADFMGYKEYDEV